MDIVDRDTIFEVGSSHIHYHMIIFLREAIQSVSYSVRLIDGIANSRQFINNGFYFQEIIRDCEITFLSALELTLRLNYMSLWKWSKPLFNICPDNARCMKTDHLGQEMLCEGCANLTEHVLELTIVVQIVWKDFVSQFLFSILNELLRARFGSINESH